jgi:alpha-L-rhamnosidase
MEALFQMDEVDIALERHKKRFEPMVNYPGFTTLWETWNFNDWGTINHSWSGGGLTVLSQYLCGIAPLEPGYKAFQVIPQPGSMKNASATVSSVAGEIKSSFENTADRFSLNAQVPPGTTAIIGIPLAYKKIKLNNKIVWKNGKYKDQSLAFMDGDTSYVKFKVQEGVWEFTATDKSK